MTRNCLHVLHSDFKGGGGAYGAPTYLMNRQMIGIWIYGGFESFQFGLQIHIPLEYLQHFPVTYNIKW